MHHFKPFTVAACRWLVAGFLFLGLNTAVLYVLVTRLGMKVLFGTIVSAEICTLLRFFLNEWWVFKSHQLSGKRMWKYHIANGGAFAVWWIGTNALTARGMNYLTASIVAVGLSTGFSFASNFFWVWRRKTPSGGPGDKIVAGRRTVAGIVLLRDDGAALLQLRDNKPEIQDPGIWVVPGGHVESGETALEGAVREFLEETRYMAKTARPLAQFTGQQLGYTGDFDMVFFWDCFEPGHVIECCEGQALEFILRQKADQLPRRDYLTQVWDLAIAARAAETAGATKFALAKP